MDAETLAFRERAVRSILASGGHGIQIQIGEEDVWLKGPNGHIRLGYFNGYSFWRENPVPRAGFRHVEEAHAVMGISMAIKEDLIKWGVSEPQYDMAIHFKPDGSIDYISGKRTEQEIINQ